MDNLAIGRQSDLFLAVLAGGQSRRMRGQDKGLVMLAGQPLFRHVLARLHAVAGRTVIVSGHHARIYAEAGFPVIGDAGIGPLGGILAAMQSAASASWWLVVPCDMPSLPSDLASRLWQAVQKQGGDLAVPVCDGTRQHAVMLCNSCLMPHLQAYLAAGGRSIHGWLDRLNPVQVEFDGCASFININTPEDLAEAVDLFSRPA